FLEDLFDRYFSKVEFNIEIKQDSCALAELVARICLQHGNLDRIIISSFHPDPLVYLAENHPEVPRACLLGEFHWPYCAHLAAPVFMKSVHTNIIHPWAGKVDENFMDQARARGWIVYPYCN